MSWRLTTPQAAASRSFAAGPAAGRPLADRRRGEKLRFERGSDRA
jgi:hypothetical protein